MKISRKFCIALKNNLTWFNPAKFSSSRCTFFSADSTWNRVKAYHILGDHLCRQTAMCCLALSHAAVIWLANKPSMSLHSWIKFIHCEIIGSCLLVWNKINSLFKAIQNFMYVGKKHFCISMFNSNSALEQQQTEVEKKVLFEEN